MILVKGSIEVAVNPVAAINTRVHAPTNLNERWAGHRRCLVLNVWFGALLTRQLVLLGWRELVARMGLEVIGLLNIGQIFIFLSDLLRFNLPTVSSRLGDYLVVVLGGQLLGALRVGRAIEHEGVHGSGDSTIPFDDLLLALAGRTMHIGVHITKGNVRQVFCRYAQGGVDFGLGALLRLLGPTVDLGGSVHTSLWCRLGGCIKGRHGLHIVRIHRFVCARGGSIDVNVRGTNLSKDGH